MKPKTLIDLIFKLEKQAKELSEAKREFQEAILRAKTRKEITI